MDRTACREAGAWCSVGQCEPTGQIHAWHLPRITVWTQSHTLKHEDKVAAVCLIPGKNKVVSASYDNRIRVWNLFTGVCWCA